MRERKANLGPSVFFPQFCDVSQSGNDSQEDLAKFGHKLNMKIILKK